VRKLVNITYLSVFGKILLQSYRIFTGIFLAKKLAIIKIVHIFATSIRA